MNVKTIVGVLLAVIVIGAAGFIMIFAGKHDLEIDSAAIEAEAAQMLPGAKPPAGHKGVLAISPEQGLRAVVIAPGLTKAKPENLEGRDLRIVIAQPPPQKDPQLEEIKAKIQHAQEMKAAEMKTLSQKPTLFEVGGKKYPGIEASVALVNGGKKLHENVTLFKNGDQVTVVLILGPEESFNIAARDQFFAGLTAPSSPLDKLPGGLKPPRDGAETPAPPVAVPTPSMDKKGPPALPRRPKRPRGGPPLPPGP